MWKVDNSIIFSKIFSQRIQNIYETSSHFSDRLWSFPRRSRFSSHHCTEHLCKIKSNIINKCYILQHVFGIANSTADSCFLPQCFIQIGPPSSRMDSLHSPGFNVHVFHIFIRTIDVVHRTSSLKGSSNRKRTVCVDRADCPSTTLYYEILHHPSQTANDLPRRTSLVCGGLRTRCEKLQSSRRTGKWIPKKIEVLLDRTSSWKRNSQRCTFNHFSNNTVRVLLDFIYPRRSVARTLRADSPLYVWRALNWS